MKKSIQGCGSDPRGDIVWCPGGVQPRELSHAPKKLEGHIESKLKNLGASDEQRAKIGGITDRMTADCGEIQ